MSENIITDPLLSRFDGGFVSSSSSDADHASPVDRSPASPVSPPRGIQSFRSTPVTYVASARQPSFAESPVTILAAPAPLRPRSATAQARQKGASAFIARTTQYMFSTQPLGYVFIALVAIHALIILATGPILSGISRHQRYLFNPFSPTPTPLPGPVGSLSLPVSSLSPSFYNFDCSLDLDPNSLTLVSVSIVSAVYALYFAWQAVRTEKKLLLALTVAISYLAAALVLPSVLAQAERHRNDDSDAAPIAVILSITVFDAVVLIALVVLAPFVSHGFGWRLFHGGVAHGGLTGPYNVYLRFDAAVKLESYARMICIAFVLSFWRLPALGEPRGVALLVIGSLLAFAGFIFSLLIPRLLRRSIRYVWLSVVLLILEPIWLILTAVYINSERLVCLGGRSGMESCYDTFVNTSFVMEVECCTDLADCCATFRKCITVDDLSSKARILMPSAFAITSVTSVFAFVLAILVWRARAGIVAAFRQQQETRDRENEIAGIPVRRRRRARSSVYQRSSGISGRTTMATPRSENPSSGALSDDASSMVSLGSIGTTPPQTVAIDSESVAGNATGDVSPDNPPGLAEGTSDPSKFTTRTEASTNDVPPRPLLVLPDMMAVGTHTTTSSLSLPDGE